MASASPDVALAASQAGDMAPLDVTTTEGATASMDSSTLESPRDALRITLRRTFDAFDTDGARVPKQTFVARART